MPEQPSELLEEGRAFALGDWLVEPTLNRISRGEEKVQLELKAMDVLLCLVAAEGRLVDKRTLIDTVWRTEFVADNTLARRVAELRQAFGDDARAPRYIETIPRRGYRLLLVPTVAGDASTVTSFPIAAREKEDGPYPGLAAFTEADAEHFFGRERQVAGMWRKIAERRLLAVAGPSGMGKSSFIRAGVVAAAPAEWGTAVLHPGEAPVAALARAIATVLADDVDAVGRLVGTVDSDAVLVAVGCWRERFEQALLVVDQFEELFTLNPSEVQTSFCELLLRIATAADVHVVLVMRDDFLFELQAQPALGVCLKDLTLLGPLEAADLKRAIEAPAVTCGHRFSDDMLAEEMMAEVAGERSALPLLAFAVRRLWERRDRQRSTLTREAYDEMGGVSGALAQHAEATLEAIGCERIPIVREIFRNLVTAKGTRAVRKIDDLLSVFEGLKVRKVESKGVRKSARPSAVGKKLGVRSKEPRGTSAASDSEQDERSPFTATEGSGFSPHSSPTRAAAAEVLGALIDARLLTSFEDHPVDRGGAAPGRWVEIVHESLLHAWPRLVRWQTQDADAAQLRDQLRQAVSLWEARGRPDDLLWSGSSYREFRLWRERYQGRLSANETDFVDATERLAGRRLRRRRALVTLAIVAALAFGSVTTVLWRRAELHSKRAEALRLTGIAEHTVTGNPPSVLAYSIASLEIMEDPRVRTLALRAVCRSPMPMAVDTRETEKWTTWSEFSPDGRWLAAGNVSGEVTLWSSEGGAARSWKAQQSPTSVTFGPRSNTLLTFGGAEPLGAFWMVPEGRRIGAVGRPQFPLMTDLSPVDSHGVMRAVRVLEGREGGDERTIDPRPLEVLRELQGQHPPRAAVSSDGNVLIFGRGRELFETSLDAPDSRPRMIGECGTDIQHVVVSRDGRRFGTSEADGTIRCWSRTEGVSVMLRSWDGPRDDDCYHLVFDRSGDQLVASYDMMGVRVFGVDDPPGAEPLLIRPGRAKTIRSDFDPSNRWLVTASLERVAVWYLDRSRHPFVLRGHEGPVTDVEFGPDGEFIVSTSSDGVVRYWPTSAAGGAEPRILHDWGAPVDIGSGSMAVSDDGRLVVAAGNRDHVRVIPLDGRRPWNLPRADQRILCVTVSANGDSVAAVGRFDNQDEIRVWHLLSGAVATLPLENQTDWASAGSIGYVSDGRLVWGVENRVWEWDPRTRRKRRLLDGVRDISLDRDGRKLIGRSGESGTIVVYDLEDGTSTPLATQPSKVFSMSLDPSGTIAVTGGWVGGVRVGKVNGDHPQMLAVDNKIVTSVSVSPGGRWIASGHGDGTIRLWRTPDLQKPPLHLLPRAELLERLKSFTNLRIEPDSEHPYSYEVRAAGSFPGWETVPEW